MVALFTNNAFSTLASGIGTGDTSLTVDSGDGALFPSPSGSDYFYATLIDTANNLEIVKCTARSTDTLTVARAQEGTTAVAYSAGDRIELRLTAAGLTDVVSQAGTAQTAAEAAQTAAEAAQTAAETAYDDFDDRYLGAKGSAPTLDNDGNALVDGAMYFDTTLNYMQVYDLGNTTWMAVASIAVAALAAEWANKAEDSLVSAAAGGDEVDDYSALHWAAKASANAVAALDAKITVSTSGPSGGAENDIWITVAI